MPTQRTRAKGMQTHANLCVFNHERHMNTLECSFVVHHQLQSQYIQVRMNTVQCHVSHILCTYVYVH